MKHNPRLNEKMARLPGFADVHPLQPVSTAQGALARHRGARASALMTMTGMSAVAMSPKAGAHGELCGMMAIKAAIEARGEAETRRVVLVPDSAHGTNPATAALIGFSVRPVPAERGRQRQRRGGQRLRSARRRGDHADQPQHLRAVRARDRRHRRGGARGRRVFLLRRRQLQRHRRQDAAGRPRRRRDAHQPAQDLLDPARRRRSRRRAGRALRSPRALRAGSVRRREGDALRLVEHAEGSASFGRMCAFHGQMGMFVRALSFILSHGADGLRQASEDAVLSANYVRASLERRDERAVRRASLHARSAVRRPVAEGHRPDDARFRQGDDRRRATTR